MLELFKALSHLSLARVVKFVFVLFWFAFFDINFFLMEGFAHWTLNKERSVDNSGLSS